MEIRDLTALFAHAVIGAELHLFKKDVPTENVGTYIHARAEGLARGFVDAQTVMEAAKHGADT